MKRMVTWIFMLILIAVAAGCGAKGSNSQTAQSGTGGTTESSATPAQGHSAGIVPGSYEDWCDEHQVPETQCTRCDPTLIPAFQTANDWCPEHGLPMSQCTIHNPNLKIVRPPKPEVE